MKDQITITGRIHFVERKADGTTVEEWIDNLVVSTGRELAASRMKDSSQSAVSHIAFGSGATPPTIGDTALQTEVLRKAATVALNQQSVLYSVTINPGDVVGEISEAGLFNAASSGVMVSRVVYKPRVILPTSSLTMTWALTFS